MSIVPCRQISSIMCQQSETILWVLKQPEVIKSKPRFCTHLTLSAPRWWKDVKMRVDVCQAPASVAAGEQDSAQAGKQLGLKNNPKSHNHTESVALQRSSRYWWWHRAVQALGGQREVAAVSIRTWQTPGRSASARRGGEHCPLSSNNKFPKKTEKSRRQRLLLCCHN